jgi:DNA polymerase eta
MLERYPELLLSSQDDLDAPLPPPPQTIDWHSSCNLVPINTDDETETDDPPQDSPSTTKPEPAKQGPPPVTWHDIALSIGGELMFRARDKIFNTLGYTTSAVSFSFRVPFVRFDTSSIKGIARNKFLAKVPSQF